MKTKAIYVQMYENEDFYYNFRSLNYDIAKSSGKRIRIVFVNVFPTSNYFNFERAIRVNTILKKYIFKISLCAPFSEDKITMDSLNISTIIFSPRLCKILFLL